MVDRPLPKAMVGPGLLAQIIIDKYADHLPLYRQMERFKREGITIAYSTIGDWIKNGCALIDPLSHALKKLILQSDYLHADETPLKVPDKNKKGTTYRGYYWVYHNSIDGLVWFDYQEGRGREVPIEILKDFKGYLQTDGYAVYDFLRKKKMWKYCIAWDMHAVNFLKQKITIGRLQHMLWSKSGCSMI